jgi:hypothetical protein
MDVIFYDSNRVEALGPVGLPPKLEGGLNARLRPCKPISGIEFEGSFLHIRPAMAAWEINPLDTKGANLGEPGL